MKEMLVAWPDACSLQHMDATRPLPRESERQGEKAVYSRHP